MRLTDDTRDEERIGVRDLTRWPTRLGRGLVWLAVELAKRVSANAVLWITAAIGCALVIALTAAGAEIYDSVEDGEGLAGFDRPVLDGAIGLRSATADQLVTWFTNLGGPVGMTIIAAAITLAMVLRWRSRTPARVDADRGGRVVGHDQHRQGRGGADSAADR
jgi:undecaprenyl-diphosphatase